MGTWITTVIICWTIGLILFGYEFDGFIRFICITAVLTLTIGWLIHAGLDIVVMNSRARAQAAADAKVQWVTNMETAGCKRSSFVGTKYSIWPVWTCPDGNAYIEEK